MIIFVGQPRYVASMYSYGSYKHGIRKLMTHLLTFWYSIFSRKNGGEVDTKVEVVHLPERGHSGMVSDRALHTYTRVFDVPAGY